MKVKDLKVLLNMNPITDDMDVFVIEQPLNPVMFDIENNVSVNTKGKQLILFEGVKTVPIDKNTNLKHFKSKVKLKLL